MNNKKPSKRGGKRPGSGRKTLSPSEKRKGVLFKLHPSTIAALQTVDNQTALIETLIRNHFELPPL